MIWYDRAPIEHAAMWRMKTESFFYCLHEIGANAEPAGEDEQEQGQEREREQGERRFRY